MTKQLSAHQFKSVYEDLGYDLGKLGCIMLDLEPLEFKVLDDVLYYAHNKERKWINGNVANKTPHVTLLYGLLRSGKEMRKHVDVVLELVDGGEYPKYFPREVTIKKVDFFDSPYEDEEYYCVVAHLEITPGLQEAHDRLTFLPHIETFAGPYKAHFTLCYIKKNERTRNSLVGALNKKYGGQTIKCRDINYGGDYKANHDK